MIIPKRYKLDKKGNNIEEVIEEDERKGIAWLAGLFVVNTIILIISMILNLFWMEIICWVINGLIGLSTWHIISIIKRRSKKNGNKK